MEDKYFVVPLSLRDLFGESFNNLSYVRFLPYSLQFILQLSFYHPKLN